jgi:hypothetical protein
MGQHDGLDVIESVPNRLEVRKDQVDTGLRLVGEQHPAVDHQQLASVLQDGHVATNLAQTAERDNTKASVG